MDLAFFCTAQRSGVMRGGSAHTLQLIHNQTDATWRSADIQVSDPPPSEDFGSKQRGGSITWGSWPIS